MAGREAFRLRRWRAVAPIVGVLLLTGCQVQRTLVPESTRQLLVSGVRRVVERPAVSGVTWAPDGRRLAYSTATRVWVTDLNGNDRAVAEVGTPRAISWSKPLDLLAVIDGGVVWTMRPDGSARKRLSLPGAAVELAWAPGSDRLAMVLVRTIDGNPRFELWVTNRDGGFQRSVAQAPKGSVIRDVYWFPDSLYLFYGLSTQGDQFTTEAWRVRVVYPDRQRFALPAHVRFLRLAPSGRLMAYLSEPAGGARRGQIVVSRLDGSGRVSLVPEVVRCEGLAWSPQGDKLAFADVRTATETEVWMAGGDGSDSVRLFAFPTEVAESTSVLSLHWRPDGRGVIVGTNTGGLTGPIWLLSLTRR